MTTTLQGQIVNLLRIHSPGYDDIAMIGYYCRAKGCKGYRGNTLHAHAEHQHELIAPLLRDAQAEALEATAYSLLGAMEYEDSPIAGEATNIRNKQRHEDAQRLFARAKSIRETP